MTKSAADLLKRLDRTGAAAMPANGEGQAGARPRASATAGQRDVRITFDLDPELHRALRLFALDQRVAASEVIRAAIRLLDDPDVRRAVLEKLDDQ